jgi:hypothetical protein
MHAAEAVRDQTCRFPTLFAQVIRSALAADTARLVVFVSDFNRPTGQHTMPGTRATTARRVW